MGHNVRVAYTLLLFTRVISKGQSGRAGIRITWCAGHGHAKEVGLGRLSRQHVALAAITVDAAMHCVVTVEAKRHAASPPRCEMARILICYAWGLSGKGVPKSLDR